MTEGKHVWQPGEKALYNSWAARSVEEVTVIRYSRSKFSRGHLVLVKGENSGRFTIHERFLSPVVMDVQK